jgi:hypothetical protein
MYWAAGSEGRKITARSRNFRIEVTGEPDSILR